MLLAFCYCKVLTAGIRVPLQPCFAHFEVPPPLAHGRPCLSTGWALNRRFEEILGPLFLWSRMKCKGRMGTRGRGGLLAMEDNREGK